ncbi:MAG: DUF4037 domain-containing protein [Lentisphaerae bacterium]|nr:DUF4037 domain-containing protein [Lentisphaerota bacterium]
MRGIECCREFFIKTGLPMLKEKFTEELPFIAAGIAGRGSECFGFDDEVSQDHDFNTGFALWLDDESEREFGFRLERAYRKLCCQLPRTAKSALGGAEHGVIRISDFFRRHLGFPGVPENWQQWYYTPSYAFAEVLNGAVFQEGTGEFSRIRQQIANKMPEDVRRKKIAHHAIMAAQSGQYNFTRCLKHHENAAAEIALNDFVRHALQLIFLLERKFAPYYKWIFRAARELPEYGSLTADLEKLLTGKLTCDEKIAAIEEISGKIIAGFAGQDLSDSASDYLEDHAFAINSRIANRELQTLHLMEC